VLHTSFSLGGCCCKLHHSRGRPKWIQPSPALQEKGVRRFRSPHCSLSRRRPPSPSRRPSSHARLCDGDDAASPHRRHYIWRPDCATLGVRHCCHGRPVLLLTAVAIFLASGFCYLECPALLPWAAGTAAHRRRYIFGVRLLLPCVSSTAAMGGR
jgi:hypothetical protein